MKITKSIFALMFGAAAVISCNKTSVPDARSFLPGEILFSDSGVISYTKAFSEATVSNLQEDGFNVAAVVDADNSVMFNKSVTFLNGTYSVPGEHYFFPKEGTMSFYAVYPKTQAITLTEGAATLSYSQNSDTDLAVAKSTGISKQSEAVGLEFSHILSQVSFNVIGLEESVDYKLKSIKVISPNGGVYSFADGKWTPNLTSTDVVIYNNTDGMEVSTSENTPVGSPVSVLPGKAKINVVWECNEHISQDLLCLKNKTLNISLNQGQHTTINLMLPFEESQLSYNVSFGVWSNESWDIKMKQSDPLAFSVNEKGKQVKFAQGNLYWNGKSFKFEKHQYDYTTDRSESHMGTFFWDAHSGRACAEKYENYFYTYPNELLFATDGKALEGYTVLDNNEWQYLINFALEKTSGKPRVITIDGNNCVVFKSDGFSGTVADSYTAEEWAIAETTGLVALPCVPYWSSNADTSNHYGSYVYFSSSSAHVGVTLCHNPHPIRLVQVVE